MLFVVAIIAVFAGLVVSSAEPPLNNQIRSTAELLATDVAYCRGLAVMNNSNYSLTFDVTNNLYTLAHSGTNTALDVLPDSPFRRAVDPPDQHVVQLGNTDGLGSGNVSLSAIMIGGTLASSLEILDFGPYGETSNAAATTIWLTAGTGSAQRYIAVTVDPVSGLAWVGDLQARGPFNGGAVLPDDLAGTYLISGS